MKINNIIFLPFVIFAFIGCVVKSSDSKSKYDLMDYNEQNFVKENNIKEIQNFYTHIDSDGNAVWNRLESRLIFNKDGLRKLKISPKYISKDLNLQDIIKGIKNSYTKILTGEIDTIFYEYDKSNNLLKEQVSNREVISYKYDQFNNKIESCVSWKIGETSCLYTIYDYLNNTGKINFIRDSVGMNSGTTKRMESIYNNQSKTVLTFKYDEEDRVIFDGIYSRKFNEKGKLIEVTKNFKEGKIQEKYMIRYGKDGNKTLLTFVRGIPARDLKDKLMEVKYDTTFVNYLYNNQKLPIEIKNIKNNKLLSLEKLNYIFF